MQVIVGGYRENLLFSFTYTLVLLLSVAVSFLIGGCAASSTSGMPDAASINIPLLEKWSGDYPVSELNLLPEGQQANAAGYIGDTETFIPVWRVFMPGEILPAVDFSKNIVVYTRNIKFYNRTNIFKIEVSPEGTAEIIAMETMSAIPIDKKVAMSMAVIPRENVAAIHAGTVKTPVIPYQ